MGSLFSVFCKALCAVIVFIEVRDMLRAAEGTHGGSFGYRALCILGDLGVMMAATWILW